MRKRTFNVLCTKQNEWKVLKKSVKCRKQKVVDTFIFAETRLRRMNLHFTELTDVYFLLYFLFRFLIFISVVSLFVSLCGGCVNCLEVWAQSQYRSSLTSGPSLLFCPHLSSPPYPPLRCFSFPLYPEGSVNPVSFRANQWSTDHRCTTSLPSIINHCEIRDRRRSRLLLIIDFHNLSLNRNFEYFGNAIDFWDEEKSKNCPSYTNTLPG